MRRLVWLCGALLALSCEVNTNNLNVDAGGSGGASGVGGCPRCAGTGGDTASGGATGAGGVSATGGTTGTGGDGQSGGTTGTGGSGQSGGTTGTGGSGPSGGTTGTGGDGQSGGTTGKGGNSGKGGSGNGGNTGSGGGATGGATGSGGQGGAPSCGALATEYGTALQAARKCTTGVANQCQALVDTTIGCSGCKTYVNDDTTLNAIVDQWTAAGCANGHVCSAIACVAPATTCVANNPSGPVGGAGTCQNSLIGGAP